MNDEVVIRSSEGLTQLILRDRQFSSNGEPEWFTVVLRGAGFHTSAQLFDFYGHGIVRFFRKLAEEWSGWEGEIDEGAEYSHIKLAATHDGLGHIKIRVSISRVDEDLSIQGNLILEPAQLDSVLDRVEEFFPEYV